MPTVCCATTPRLSPETVLGFTAWVLWSDLHLDDDDPVDGEGELKRLERERGLSELVGWMEWDPRREDGWLWNTRTRERIECGVDATYPKQKDVSSLSSLVQLRNLYVCALLEDDRDGGWYTSCFLLLTAVTKEISHTIQFSSFLVHTQANCLDPEQRQWCG